MNSKSKLITLAIGFAAWTALSEDFRNGSFEMLDPDATHSDSTQLLGWAMSEGGAAWLPGCGRYSVYKAVDGNRLLGFFYGPATLSQTFYTKPGEFYAITFHVFRDSSEGDPIFLTAKVTDDNTEEVACYSAEAPSTPRVFLEHRFHFYATSTNSTLSFCHTNTIRLGLDGVSVIALSEPLSLGMPSYPVVEIRGVVGRSYIVEFTETLGDGAAWKALSVVSSRISPYLFVDTSARVSRQRFYRLSVFECGQ